MIDDTRLSDLRLKDIDARVDSSLRFFKPLSKTNRWAFEGLGTMQILLGAAIPILALQHEANQLYTALAGALVATVKGIETLSKPQETWLRAAATISRLYSERALFNARAVRIRPQRTPSRSTPRTSTPCCLRRTPSGSRRTQRPRRQRTHEKSESMDGTTGGWITMGANLRMATST
jgi:uncharacterized protein DUF4231